MLNVSTATARIWRDESGASVPVYTVILLIVGVGIALAMATIDLAVTGL